MSLLDRLFTRTAPVAAQAAIVLAPEVAPEVRPETLATFGALAKAFPPSLASRDYREIADAREVAFGGGDSWDRLPFRDLRLLADNADLLRLAIETIVGTIKGMDWSLVTEDGSDPDPKADALLLKPDGKLDWDAWAAMAIEEILVCDNLCLFPYYQGGRLVRLEVIDGATITPKLDAGGRIPDPPAIAFEQSTSNSSGGPKKFTTQQLWYRPQRRRVYSVRGFSPTEQVAARAAVNFYKLLRDLYRWQKGGTPAGLVPAPDGIGTLEKLQTYQAWLDQRLKEPGADSRLQAVMGGTSKYFPTPPPRIDKEHEELLIRTIFNAFGVDPTAMVSQVNYSTADALATWAALRGMRPHLFALQTLAKEMLEAAGFPGHELQWKVEQEAMAAERRQSQLDRYKAGLVAWEDMVSETGESVDEADVAQKHYFVVGLPAQPFDPLGLAPAPEPPPPPPAGAVPPQLAPFVAESKQTPPAALGKAIREDLRRWETVVRKAVSAGKTPREFVSDVVPRWQQEIVRKALAAGSGLEAFKARKFSKGDVKRAATSDRMIAVLPSLQAAALAVIKQQAEHFAAIAVEQAAKVATTATKATKLLPVHGPANVSVTVAEFRSLVRALYDAFSSGVDDSADLLGYGALSGTTAMDYAIQRAGELIGRTYSEKTGTWIDNPNERWQLLPETRDRVDSVLQQALDGQWTEKQLRDALNEVINDDARAAMIARTEGAMAYNEGTARNWQGQGVEWVKILDDEGPNSCAECEAANGQVWTMDEFLANVIEHPNCVRAAVPAELGEEVGWGD